MRSRLVAQPLAADETPPVGLVGELPSKYGCDSATGWRHALRALAAAGAGDQTGRCRLGQLVEIIRPFSQDMGLTIAAGGRFVVPNSYRETA
jgi:hypothetical protein